MAMISGGRKGGSAFLWISTTFVMFIVIICLITVDRDTFGIPNMQLNPTLLSKYLATSGARESSTCSRNSIDELISNSEEIRERFNKKRKAYIAGRNMSQMNPWVSAVYFWDYFPPTFTCPYLIERIGNLGGGGKWMCGFELFDKKRRSAPCVVYSFGVGGDSSFEAEVLERTPCSVFAYDNTVNSLNLAQGTYDESRIKFAQTGLGGKNSGSLRTLGEYMRANGHAFIDLLKVDIDFSEFDALDQIMGEFKVVPFGHLNIEIHITLSKKLQDLTADGPELQRFNDWWTRLEDKGLRAYTWETNHHPCVSMKIKPFALEYSFLNIKNMIK